jgi:hypothetical protein
MKRYEVNTPKVEVGFEFQTRTLGYRVERIVWSNGDTAICVLEKTKGTYTGNHVMATLHIRKEGS